MKFPKRMDAATHQFRVAVPVHLRARLAGRRIAISLPNAGRIEPRIVEPLVREDIKFSLGTRDDATAEILRAAAKGQVERYFAAVEAGPVSVSHRDLVALSGAVYRLYTETHLDNPGDPDTWAAFKAFNRAAAEGRILTAPALAVGEAGDDEEAFGRFGEDLTTGVNALPVTDSTAALEDRFGTLATWVCCREGIDLDAETRILLLRQVAAACLDAGWALKRAAQGDYSPDPRANRFPPIEKPNAAAISICDLFDRWRKETKPAGSTVTNWRTVVDRLEKELGAKCKDIRRIGPDEVIQFKDALVTQGLKPKTISDSYLAATKALFNFAVMNRLVPANPTTGIKVAIKKQAGEDMLPYETEAVAKLLALAGREKLAHVRWLPLLAAATGARIGELSQLWGDRIFQREGIWCMHIAPAPDGGTLKNMGSERIVPIHSEVIRRGFLTFVEGRGRGPLFYGRPGVIPEACSPKEEGRHISVGPGNRVSTWVRACGFTDPRIDPSHGLRHWWKSEAVLAKIEDSVADAIQGHGKKTVAGLYRKFKLATFAEAIEKMPIPTTRD